ncbi:MAG: tRNA pseudouridine(38-40) synthase TruA, partial [Candidatus Xenobia bacterium]
MSRNIRLVVEYDGAAFSGFQKLTGRTERTIQGDLEAMLSQVLDQPIRIQCAGRTDAGVHACAQVINFHTTSDRPLEHLRRALNGLFHGDLVVHEAREVPATFNARHSALSRGYEYLVFNGETPPSVLRGYLMHVRQPLQGDLMEQAAARLRGRHDFKAFCSQGAHLKQTWRTVMQLGLERLPAQPDGPAIGARLGSGHTWRITVEAEAFLPHMVRMMVGTLVRVGQHELTPDQVTQLLECGAAGAAGPP